MAFISYMSILLSHAAMCVATNMSMANLFIFGPAGGKRR